MSVRSRLASLRRACAVALAVVLPPAMAQAQHITIDGSLSPAQTLSAVNGAYSIPATLGRQVGGNLFQSFGIFGLAKGESATFCGAACPSTANPTPVNATPINNVIARVTGGSQSTIQGAISTDPTTLPGASLYLINPAGIVFGPGATVSVAGGFHASTADYLRLSDGAKFQATNPGGSTFSAAPPAAFGFINNTPPTLTVEGTTVTVGSGQAIGLAAGPVSISGSNLSAPGGTIAITAAGGPGEVPLSRQAAPASVNSYAGVALSGGSTLSVSDPSGGGSGGAIYIHSGTTSITGGSLLDADNYGSGAGGQVVLNSSGNILLDATGSTTPSAISAQSMGSGPAGLVTITTGNLQLSGGSQILVDSPMPAGGSAGAISIAAQGSITLDGSGAGSGPSGVNPTYISASSYGSGPPGQIAINAANLSLSNGATIGPTIGGTGGNVAVNAGDLTINGLNGGSEINANALSGSVNAGTVAVTADNILITANGVIASFTLTQGNAGRVTVSASGTITIDGTGGMPQYITGVIADAEPGSIGNAGSVSVSAPVISLTSGGEISSATFASGNSGAVSVQAGQLAIDGATGFSTGVVVSNEAGSTGASGSAAVSAGTLTIADNGQIAARALGSGPGGVVDVSAGSLALTTGGQIRSTTVGPGNGGSVAVSVAGDATITGASSAITAAAVGPTGNAGDVGLNVGGALTVSGGGEISSTTVGAGKGGDIGISAADISLTGAGPQIAALSTGGGAAGTITISATNLTLSNQAAISTAAATAAGGNITLTASNLLYLRQADITTSSEGVKSNGGNITIDPPPYVVLADGSTIDANAFGGNGGNILINAGEFVASADSAVTASSQEGIAGTITITGQETAINSGFVVLSTALGKAETILRQSCAVQGATPRSSLVDSGRGGLPEDPDQMLPALYVAGRPLAGPMRQGADRIIPLPPSLPSSDDEIRPTMGCGTE
jgi:filamentous hemagglutinin family protein